MTLTRKHEQKERTQAQQFEPPVGRRVQSVKRAAVVRARHMSWMHEVQMNCLSNAPGESRTEH